MKTRFGFVSNSSSSSFVFVGFPKESIQSSTVDYKAEVISKFTKREIDTYVCNEICNDGEYEAYFSGNSTPEFWKNAWKFLCEGSGDDDAPDGFECHTVWSEQQEQVWFGIGVAYVDGGGTDIVDLKKINLAINKIKKQYPNVTPKVILGAQNE